MPVTSFAEPKEVTPATWHWFTLTGDDPRPPFAFAGLWRHHFGPIKKHGEPVELHVYSIMTTTPNALVGSINHERMPILLSSEDDFETWMNGTADDAFKMIRKYPAKKMQMVQSGFEKRSLDESGNFSLYPWWRHSLRGSQPNMLNKAAGILTFPATDKTGRQRALLHSNAIVLPTERCAQPRLQCLPAEG